MFGWFYKLFAANRFKSQSHLAFGLVRAFKESILSCIEEIIITTQSDYTKIASLYNKYKVLNNALEECYYSKDEFDYVTKYSDPIIAPAQESRLRFLRKLYWLSIVVFFVVETILFYMIAQNITGGMVKQIENLGRQYAWVATMFLFIASAIFALLSALMLDAGLRQLFYYFKAKKHYDKKFINSAVFRSAVVKLTLGITLIVGAVTVLFLMNWARSYAIDSTGANSSSNNPILVYALVALSVFAGIAFGLVKKELAENSELLNLANKWNKIRQDMANCVAKMTEFSIHFHNQFELIINKSLLLGVHLQELMQREYDERDIVLLSEFRDKLKNGEFHGVNRRITNGLVNSYDAYYYNNLITNEELLHRNQFTSDIRLSYIINDIGNMVNEINDLEKTRLTKLFTANPLNGNNRVINNQPNAHNIAGDSGKPELSTTNSENIFDEGQINNNKNNHSLNGTLIDNQ